MNISSLGDFEKAVKRSKNAENNSSVESDNDNCFKRPTKKPGRFEDSSDGMRTLQAQKCLKMKPILN